MRHGPGPHVRPCRPAHVPAGQHDQRFALYAACGRYASQAAGIVGLATWMKISARGVRGAWRGCIPAWRGRRSPLRRLQGAHEATMFSQLELPPLERGITWSTVRFEREPQYWQVQLSLANTARR